MLLEVGRIRRAHGARGETLVRLTTERTERLAAGSRLHTDRGPLTVRAARAHRDCWLVRFEEIPDRKAAEDWRGTALRAEAVAGAADGALWVHELVGATVRLPDGRAVGTVEAVQANPAADLLVLDRGALVPVNFVVAHAPGRVVIDPPEGLLEL